MTIQLSLEWLPTPGGWIVSDHSFKLMLASGLDPVKALDAMCWATHMAKSSGFLPELIEVRV